MPCLPIGAVVEVVVASVERRSHFVLVAAPGLGSAGAAAAEPQVYFGCKMSFHYSWPSSPADCMHLRCLDMMAAVVVSLHAGTA